MGRRLAAASLALVAPVALWAACTGDDPSLSTSEIDAAVVETSAESSPIADGGVDAMGNADAPSDGPSGSLCDGPVPATPPRSLECGDGLLCNLDTTSPPLRCCIGSQPDSGECVQGGFQAVCASPKFLWECTRGNQCPSPGPCCLTTKNQTATCPVTATALSSRCDTSGTDAGCMNDLQLCTGNEPCPAGKVCHVLDILAPDHRAIGACL